MTDVVEVDCRCPRREAVELAANVIKRGGLVVAPTDTVYGILADPFNPEAVTRVYRVKGRDPGKPLPLLLGESHHALRVVTPSDAFWRLAERFWPGPLTIVEEPATGLPSHLASWGRIGVRLPDCPLVREIARLVGGVLVGTSANKSGRESPSTVYDAGAQLGNNVDLYLDGGPTLYKKSSTVVVLGEQPVVLREGALPSEEVLRVIYR